MLDFDPSNIATNNSVDSELDQLEAKLNLAEAEYKRISEELSTLSNKVEMSNRLITSLRELPPLTPSSTIEEMKDLLNHILFISKGGLSANKAS
jgi:septation ring formation regulator EzrA